MNKALKINRIKGYMLVVNSKRFHSVLLSKVSDDTGKLVAVLEVPNNVDEDSYIQEHRPGCTQLFTKIDSDVDVETVGKYDDPTVYTEG